MGRSTRICAIGLFCLFSMALAGGLADPPDAAAQTQLRLDGTLPGGRTDDLVLTQPGPIYTIDESFGAARGDNLFHSFADFSIGAGDTASFTSAQPFERVLVRVTGGDASTINGTLRSSVMNALGDGSDFFLLNPAGILFGAGSAIDVAGSLFLSSADTLSFDNADVLDVLGPAPPVLSVASPESFGFRGGDQAGEISFIENGGFGFLALGVPEGETLAAIGGDIRAAGPTGFLSLQTPGGRMALVAAGSAAADVDANDFETTTAEPEALGLVSVGPGASLGGLDIIEPNDDQGSLVIRGGRLEVINADIGFGGNPSTGDLALDIELSDTLEIGDSAFISTIYFGDSDGTGGRIAAENIEIDGTGSGIFLQTTGSGDGGPLAVEATNITIENGGRLVTRAESRPGATGQGGDLDITTETLTLRSSGRIESTSNTEAPGGAVTIAADQILIEDGGALVSANASAANANLVRIDAGELTIRDGGQIETSTTGTGAGSALEIGGGTLDVTRTPGATTAGLIVTTSAAGATGRGGSVMIDVDDVEVSGGGQITTTTAGGDAGDLSLNVADEVLVRGEDDSGTPSGLFSRALDPGRGAGGDIQIDAETVRVEDGAFVSSSSETVANAGDITITARDAIEITGFGSFGSTLSTQATLAGAGDINLDAPRIEITDGSGLDLRASGSQPSGRLTITGGDLILEGKGPSGVQPSSLTARTDGSGAASGIEIQLSGDLALRDGASITSSSRGSGAAGDLSIESENVRLSGGAALLAEATAGADAGRITVNAANAVQLSGSAVETEALAGGAGGQIEISAGDRIEVGSNSAITTEAASGVNNGGDLTLNAPKIVVGNADLIARAVGGNGGSIQLNAGQILTSAESLIDASSALGIDGQILLANPAEDLSGELGRPAANPTDPSDRLARACDMRSEIEGSLVVQANAEERRFDGDDLLRSRRNTASSQEGAQACAR
ncbi:MAG: filamentous hemagglutinin N-terminal domain-containing protein [Myxococcota bacterium]